MVHLLIFWYSIANLLVYGEAIVLIEDFFGYGPQHGDKEVTLLQPTNWSNAETSSSAMELDPPFSMFGISLNHIHIDDDGSFFANDTSMNGSQGRIWAFSGRVNLHKGGHAYWRKSTSSADVEKARHEIGSAFAAYQDLDLKWVIIASWIQIFPYGSFHDSTNTFQAILTTDGNLTFAIFNYNEMRCSKKFWKLGRLIFGKL